MENIQGGTNCPSLFGSAKIAGGYFDQREIALYFRKIFGASEFSLKLSKTQRVLAGIVIFKFFAVFQRILARKQASEHQGHLTATTQ